MREDNRIDEALLDRFFERQRREIIDRIHAERSERWRRLRAVSLAASVLLLLGFGTSVLLWPLPAASGAAAGLWEIPVDSAFVDGDPLAPFGDWWSEDGPEAGEYGVLDAFVTLEPLADEPSLDELPELLFDMDEELLRPAAESRGSDRKG